MKSNKTILLLLLFFINVIHCYAQSRNINLDLKSRYTSELVYISPSEGSFQQFQASQQNYLHFDVKNYGPDMIMTGDSFFFKIPSLNINISWRFDGSLHGDTALGNGLVDAVGATLQLNYDASITSSQSYTLDVCDTAWVTDAHGVVINDIDLSNNFNCHNSIINVWYLNVDNISDLSGFNLYPNPAATTLNIASNYSNAKNVGVIIHDLIGKTVLSKNLGANINGQKTFNLDISKLATGFYIFELNKDGKRSSRQIQIQK
ncbi:MAG: T9SS type A sorting domain-containing protein [Sphingobacteriales bacterium]|nr:MAG: T9SS type A sorting domain-containing protein [Sphingobacteriales bacterium]